MDPLGHKLLQIAQGQLGYSERPSGYTKFGDWYYRHVDHSDSEFKTAPWCDMFIAWAAHRAGMEKSVGTFAYTPSHARWFKKHHAWGHRPEPGSLVFLTWSGGRSLDSIDHIGLVERVDGGKLHTIEANVDGGHLRRKVRDESQAVGFGYPSKVAPPKTRPAPRPAPPPGVSSTPRTTAHHSPLVDNEAMMSGLLAVVVLGTVMLALGKAKVAIPAPPVIRVRKRGKHHRTRVPAAMRRAAAVRWDDPQPADLRGEPAYETRTPPAYVPEAEPIEAATLVTLGADQHEPASVPSTPAEDAALWSTLEQDEDLAFWDTVHTVMTQAGPPPLLFDGRPGPSAVLLPPGRGRQVAVAFDDVPIHIAGRDGLAWDVHGIIGYWEHPDLSRYGWVPGYRAEAQRWDLNVDGPLPGRPDAYGEQRVILRDFGGRSGWYLTPA